MVPLVEGLKSEDVRDIFYSIFPSEDSEQFEKFISKADFEMIKGEKMYLRRPLILKLEGHFVKSH